MKPLNFVCLACIVSMLSTPSYADNIDDDAGEK